MRLKKTRENRAAAIVKHLNGAIQLNLSISSEHAFDVLIYIFDTNCLRGRETIHNTKTRRMRKIRLCTVWPKLI